MMSTDRTPILDRLRAAIAATAGPRTPLPLRFGRASRLRALAHAVLDAPEAREVADALGAELEGWPDDSVPTAASPFDPRRPAWAVLAWAALLHGRIAESVGWMGRLDRLPPDPADPVRSDLRADLLDHLLSSPDDERLIAQVGLLLADPETDRGRHAAAVLRGVVALYERRGREPCASVIRAAGVALQNTAQLRAALALCECPERFESADHAKAWSAQIDLNSLRFSKRMQADAHKLLAGAARDDRNGDPPATLREATLVALTASNGARVGSAQSQWLQARATIERWDKDAETDDGIDDRGIALPVIAWAVESWWAHHDSVATAPPSIVERASRALDLARFPKPVQCTVDAIRRARRDPWKWSDARGSLSPNGLDPVAGGEPILAIWLDEVTLESEVFDLRAALRDDTGDAVVRSEALAGRVDSLSQPTARLWGPVVRYWLGVSLAIAGETGRAEQLLERVAAESATLAPKALAQRAMLALAGGDTPLAKRLVESLAPRDPGVLYAQAITKVHEGRVPEARSLAQSYNSLFVGPGADASPYQGACSRLLTSLDRPDGELVTGRSSPASRQIWHQLRLLATRALGGANEVGPILLELSRMALEEEPGQADDPDWPRWQFLVNEAIVLCREDGPGLPERDWSPLAPDPLASLPGLWSTDPSRCRRNAESLLSSLNGGAEDGPRLTRGGIHEQIARGLASLALGDEDAYLSLHEVVWSQPIDGLIAPAEFWTSAAAILMGRGDWTRLLEHEATAALREVDDTGVRETIGLALVLAAAADVSSGRFAKAEERLAQARSVLPGVPRETPSPIAVEGTCHASA